MATVGVKGLIKKSFRHLT